jgi:dipeptidyl aminopeptidase/acylaminoacyl peptidase
MSAGATTRRPVMPDDIFNYAFVQDPQVSPDGKHIAYVVETLEGDERRYRGQIYVVPVDGGEPHAVTGTDQNAASPRWSPDGSEIAFRLKPANDKDARFQVFTANPFGGGAEQAASLTGGVSDFAWSPDGRQLVLTGTGQEPGDAPATLRVTRLHYKGDGVGLLLGERTHLWLADIGSEDEPRQLTDDDEDDGGVSFSPDGRWIAFNRTRPSEGGAAPYNDVWVLEVATGEARNLTNGRGPAFRPSWSPDSSTLAFAHHTEPNDIWWGANYKIWTVPVTGGEPQEATAGFPHLCARAVSGSPSRGIGWPGAQWSADGQYLYFVATVGGTVNIYRVAAGGGEVQAVTEGAQVVTGFALAGERIVYGITTPTTLPDLWSIPAGGGTPTRLTDVNATLFSEIAASPAERFTFESFDGLEIEGWLIPPAGFDASSNQQHPLVLHIHGGPHGAYGEAYNHSWQALSGAGYFVLYTNPRGSQGYGEDFAKLCIGDWGGGDYRDLLAAVDHIVARGHVNNTRVGAWGASYGGYMTSWIAGHTDRFAAIVSDVPVTNLYSFYGTSDIGHYFAPFEMGGVQPWEDPQKYLFHSPVSYAKDVVTPLLLTHREDDMRCPISQSEEFYAQLKSLGKTVEFLRVADASHGIVPAARGHAERIHLGAALEWFGKYMGVNGG